MLTSKVRVWLWRLSTTKKSEKEQHAGKETLHFDWFAPHFRHRFVTNFHYDGTIQRHLGARTNQSAIRHQPTWHKFPIHATGLGLALAREHHSSNLIESLVRNQHYWSGTNFLIWSVPWPKMFLEWGWFLDSVESRSTIRSLRIVNFTGQVCLSVHLSLSPGFCEFCNQTFFIMSFPSCMICALDTTTTFAMLVTTKLHDIIMIL